MGGGQGEEGVVVHIGWMKEGTISKHNKLII